MIIVKATNDDLASIMLIVNQAKVHLKSVDCNQWQDGYPNEDAFVNDINNNRLYVVKDNDVVVACYVLVKYEPTYDTIKEGNWLDNSEYVAVHRIAVRNEYKGKGIAKYIFDNIKKEYKHIRVDTHKDNKNMNKCLINNGFIYCGIIYLSRNSESDITRLAYEYIEK